MALLKTLYRETGKTTGLAKQFADPQTLVGETMEKETATFAAGNFWDAESVFRSVKGVVETQVGYSGGGTPNPTHDEVTSGRTGHAEVVRITYDRNQIEYATLLEYFWDMHDPTDDEGECGDDGRYRSVIFAHSAEQESIAEKSLRQMDASGMFAKKVSTEIEQATEFYPAEEYHQRYKEKRFVDSCCFPGDVE